MLKQSVHPGIKRLSNGVFATALFLLIIEIKVLRVEDQFSVSEIWLSLKYLSPFFFTFLLSFVIILISWFNHQSILLLIDKSSRRFIYANAVLLLTILLLPFPAAFLAQHGLTNLARPAVAVFSFVNLIQAIAWAVMLRSAFYPHRLGVNDRVMKTLQAAYKKWSYVSVIYASCTILAFWFPQEIAMVITITWIFMTGVWFISKERDLSS